MNRIESLNHLALKVFSKHACCLLLCLYQFSMLSGFATEVPSGFTLDTIATDLNAATAITIDRDGRILLLDQTGKILVIKNNELLPNPMLTVEVDAYWERGLIGIALHPEFPQVPHLYINHTPAKPYTRHRISRFTVRGDRADPSSELILFEGDDQSTLGGTVPHGHQGGPIRFGPDRKLYVALGEQTAGKPSQKLDSLLGKILRINPDGTIPNDNPFYTKTTGKYRAIWATGIRNPYGLEFHPETGALYENDVGQSSWEEINIIKRGANYGWPEAEGNSTDSRFTNPIHAYPPVIGRSITGGTFYRGGESEFPEEYKGKYFFLDFMNHWVRFLDLETPETSRLFGKNFNGPVDIQNGPDGALYVLNRGTIWRDGKRHIANSGSLQRIRYTGIESFAATQSETLPESLAATLVFDQLDAFKLQDGFHPLYLNAPRWQAGVVRRLWIRLPDGTPAQPSKQTTWKFPAGTTIVEHFDSDKGVRFETRLYWATDSNCYRAAAYRWNGDQSNAFLIEDTEITTLPDEPKRNWLSPGYESCLNLDTVVSGFFLELTTRQLNTETPSGNPQLKLWQERGWLSSELTLSELLDAPRLASLANPTATLEHKVRSYLDANCATCHFPGGPSRGQFDARFETSLSQQGLINGALAAGDLGITGARIVVPGKPDQSILYQRLKRKDFFRMPPVALNADAPPILDTLRTWIEMLKP